MAAKKAKKTTIKAKKVNKKKMSVMARTDDGAIQITMTIPWALVASAREAVAVEMGQDMTIKGFRKGKAPLAKVMASIAQDKLVERTLNKILPKIYTEAVIEQKIRPIMQPKIEILKSDEEKDWEVRATTAELPEVKLPDYKKQIKGELASKSIAKDKGDTAPSKEQKEQIVADTLLKNINFDIPGPILEDEVNHKLSHLLERIEKLGLSLDDYLKSIGKNPQDLRAEYESQAKDTLKLDIILTEIANTENVMVKENELEDFIKQTSNDPNIISQLKGTEQEGVIRSILRKRKVLDMLSSL